MRYTLLIICLIYTLSTQIVYAKPYATASSVVETDVSEVFEREGDKGFFYNVFGVEWAPLQSLKKWWNKTEYTSSTPITPSKKPSPPPTYDTTPETTDTTTDSAFSRITLKSILDYVDDPARYLEADVPQVCSLVDSFGWWIQSLGGLLASSVLILKWRWERPQRPAIIWFLDSFKNGSSQLAAHFLSVYIAEFASTSSPAHVSPCSWYLWVFIIDITLGVALAFLLLKLWGAALKGSPVGKSGNYGQVWDPETGRVIVPPDYSVYWGQFGVWIGLCVLPSRIVCGSLVAVFAETLLKPATLVSEIFAGHPRAELIFVLLLGPVVMNAVQFLIQDAFLIAQPKAHLVTDKGSNQMFIVDNGGDSEDYMNESLTVSDSGFIGGESAKMKEFGKNGFPKYGGQQTRSWGAAWDDEDMDDYDIYEMGLGESVNQGRKNGNSGKKGVGKGKKMKKMRKQEVNDIALSAKLGKALK